LACNDIELKGKWPVHFTDCLSSVNPGIVGFVQKLISSLGPVCGVVGAQWGDEGKGKVVDILAAEFNVIARAAGGANAGHTIEVEGEERIFHLLPSGVLHGGKTIVLGSGMVIHLPTLLTEIAACEDLIPRLSISKEAHIVFDYHKTLDALFEERRAKSKGEGIGTTKRGIGPAFMDKASRSGLRMELLLEDASSLEQLLTERCREVQEREGITIDIERELAQLQSAQKTLAGCITDTVALLHAARDGGQRILIEGAQGSLLDLDHGSYPYVTSSATTSSGALQGLGLPPQCLTSCLGIVKAYCTRVGGGGFPTEASEEVASRIREKGGEYGATTKRPRRCGWLSLPDLKKTSKINGITHWNLTKLDVLDGEASIPVAVDMNGEKAIYEELPGWQGSIAGMTTWEELPREAQRYVEFLEKETGISVVLIGTGKGRESMVVR
jgi:adenylosuccinate synthase